MYARAGIVRFLLLFVAVVFALAQFAYADTPANGAYSADQSINTQCPSGTDPKTGYPVNYSCKYPGLNQKVNNGVASYEQCELDRPCDENKGDVKIKGQCVAAVKCEATSATDTTGKSIPLSSTKLPASPTDLVNSEITGSPATGAQLPPAQTPPDWKDPNAPSQSEINDAFQNGTKPVDFLPQSANDTTLSGLNANLWTPDSSGNSVQDQLGKLAGQSLISSVVGYLEDTNFFNGWGNFGEGSTIDTSGNSGGAFESGAAPVSTGPSTIDYNSYNGAPVADPYSAAPTAPGAGSNTTGFQATGETNAASQSDQNFYQYLYGQGAPQPSPSYPAQASDLNGKYTLSNGGTLTVNSEGATYSGPGGDASIPPEDLKNLSTNDLINEVAPGSTIGKSAGYNPANETGQSVTTPSQPTYAWYDPRGWFNTGAAQAEPAPNPNDLIRSQAPVGGADNGPAAAPNTIPSGPQNSSAGGAAGGIPGLNNSNVQIPAGSVPNSPPAQQGIQVAANTQPGVKTDAPGIIPPAPVLPNTQPVNIGADRVHTQPSPQAVPAQGSYTQPVQPTPTTVTPTQQVTLQGNLPNTVLNNNGTPPQASVPPPTQPQNQVLAASGPPVLKPVINVAPVFPIMTWNPTVPASLPPTTAQSGAPSPLQSTQYGPIATCPPGRPCANIPVQSQTQPVVGSSVSVTPTNANTTATATSSNTFSALVNSLLKAIGIPTSDLQSVGKSIVQPTATLVVNTPTVSRGGNVQLLWTSSGTQNCTVYDGAGQQIGTGGSDGSATAYGITQTAAFTLRCVTSQGSLISSQATVVAQ